MQAHLPEGTPQIPLHDLRRILEMAKILEEQHKLPFNLMVNILQHFYMLGFLQSGVENAVKIRQQLDAAIAVMRS